MKVISLAGVLVLALAFSANADIIPSKIDVTTSGPTYTWDYMAHLTTDESLNPLATSNLTSCSNAPCSPPGTFFTIYDFAGYVPGSIAATAAGWGASTQLVGKTPQNISPVDSPTVTNLIFTYTGAMLAGPLDIYGFSAQSTFNTVGAGTYSTQATKNVIGELAGTTDQNFGNVEIPVSPTPEPGYMLLLISAAITVVVFSVKATQRN
jgi:hypothetical protein